MLLWVALDTDLVGLRLEHTRNWCKLETLSRSWKEKKLVMTSMELGILVELGIHLVEEERMMPRQPSRPWVPF